MGNDTKPKPVRQCGIALHAFDADTHRPLSGAEFVLGTFTGNLNDDGYIYRFPFDEGISLAYAIRAKDYATTENVPIKTIYPNQQIEIPIKRIVPVVPPITPAGLLNISGKKFLVNGQVTRIQELTAFTAYSDFCNGKDLKPFYAFARSLNANCIRVFASIYNIVKFDPRSLDPDFSKLKAFLEECKSEGLFVEISFADTQFVFDTKDNFVVYFKSFVNVIKDYSNILFSFFNEPFKNVPNGVDVESFLQELKQYIPLNVIYSLGASNHSDGSAYQPTGDYTELHPTRDETIVDGEAEWVRHLKDVYDYREAYSVPCIANEPMGAGTASNRDSSPIRFKKAIALASLYGNVCIHSTALITCDIPTGIELECVIAGSQGWNAIPSEFLNGYYTRFGPAVVAPPILDEENGKRFYFSVLADKARGVRITGKTDVNSAPGWKITSTDEDKVLFTLETV